jgi:sugar-specific transcriptional regulator TrmB
MVGANEQSVRALEGLGFSRLEAAIYSFLAGHSPATGYRVAQAIGKPVANTYKGLSALASRGVVVVEDGPSRLCRAVAADELFGKLQKDLQAKCSRAADALAKVEKSGEDGRVYRLDSRQQVLERTRQMIRGAREVVLISAFPEPLEEIREELESAAARGVKVLLKAYRPVEVKGMELIFSNEGEELLEMFPGQELNLTTDAEQMLVAVLPRKEQEDDERIIQAVWSASVFLSVLHYNGLYSEWLLTRLNGMILAGADSKALKASLKRSFPLMQTPGYRQLVGELKSRGDGAGAAKRRRSS